MGDKELYHELVLLTKHKEAWKDNIAYVYSLLLGDETYKIKAKALWLLGEMGLLYPDEIEPCVDKIASFLDSTESLFRERALNALGRIGRARYSSVKLYMEKMSECAADECFNVRLAFIWASENIATQTPDAYERSMDVFANLLCDSDDRVRMEAPEMFRVMGKRRPKWVIPYLERLQQMAESDTNPVVRIHAAGAIRITNQNIKLASQVPVH